jgi:selenoprotein W-related protein
MRPRLEIEYCTQCRWLLRAAWLAQELLTTFEQELGEVALVPGTGGVLEVRLDGEVIFSRAREGRFPESKELKQSVRDRIAPDKPLVPYRSRHDDSREAFKAFLPPTSYSRERRGRRGKDRGRGGNGILRSQVTQRRYSGQGCRIACAVRLRAPCAGRLGRCPLRSPL